MSAPFKQYFSRRKNRRSRRNYIFSEACFHKILWFLCCSTSIFYPRANDKFGTPLGGGGGGVAPLDLSVREGDRKNQFAMRLNCA